MSKATKKAARKRKPASDAVKALWRKHSKARAKRYKADPMYAADVREKSRQAMQAKRGTKLADCRTNLGDLNEIGSVRTCMLNGEPINRLCFTFGETGEAMMVSHSRVRVWARDGIVPPPIVQAKIEDEKVAFVSKPTVPVYLKDEVVAMMTILGEHRSRIAFIRKDQHAALIAKSNTAIKDARRRLGIG